MQRIFAFDDPKPAFDPEVFDDEAQEEFELVVGRRQVAGILFLAVVVVVVCAGGAYLAGKATSARQEPDPPEIRLEQPPVPSAAQAAAPMTTPLPTPQSDPMIEATIVRPPAATPAAEAPLFANPVPQAIYIQVGAVEKGVAVILAEGLRKHALDSFVAPGPNGNVLRVLIGPFPDAEAYQKARNIVDQIGLASFARRYQQQ